MSSWGETVGIRFEPGGATLVVGPRGILLLPGSVPALVDQTVFQPVLRGEKGFAVSVALDLLDLAETRPGFIVIETDDNGTTALVGGASIGLDTLAGQTVVDGRGLVTWTEHHFEGRIACVDNNPTAAGPWRAQGPAILSVGAFVVRPHDGSEPASQPPTGDGLSVHVLFHPEGRGSDAGDSQALARPITTVPSVPRPVPAVVASSPNPAVEPDLVPAISNWLVPQAQEQEQPEAPQVVSDTVAPVGLPDWLVPSLAEVPSEASAIVPALASSASDTQMNSFVAGAAPEGLTSEVSSLREQFAIELKEPGGSKPVAPTSMSDDRRPLIQAKQCTCGGLNAPSDDRCRTCGLFMPEDRELMTGPRTGIGSMRFTSGHVEVVDGPLVLGRNPPQDHRIGGEIARPIRIDDPTKHVSGFHLEVRVDGWSVSVVDMDSTNRTWVTLPGREAIKLRAREPMTIVGSATLDLGGSCLIQFEERL